MLEMKCNEFIDKLGSNEPVPGGGSASALVGALGIALGTMVGELTTGKKTYAMHEEELGKIIPASRELTEKMKAAVNKDVTAFEPLAKAYRMPNGTPEEKQLRQVAIDAGVIDAAIAPLELAELCVEALKLLDRYSVIGSRLAVSDAGTGAVFCEAALKGAKLNVLINLKSIKDENIKTEFTDRIEKASDECAKLASDIYSRVEAACRG